MWLCVSQHTPNSPHTCDPAQAEVALVQPAVAERVVLQGLTIQLGPDLRTTYPVVMNFNISGQVDVTGPADANRLQLQGTIKLDSGEVSFYFAPFIAVTLCLRALQIKKRAKCAFSAQPPAKLIHNG